VAVTGVLTLTGCAVSVDSGDATDDVATSQAALSVFGGASWNELNPPQFMAPTFNSTCFLTAVGGHFEGGGEWVGISDVRGNWTLNGNTMQFVGGGAVPTRDALSASGACVSSPITAGGSWDSKHSPVKLQHGGSCFLTRFAGKFIDGGDSVLTWQDANGDWWLGGSIRNDGLVGANAACVANTLVRTAQRWNVARWTFKALHDDPPHTRACFLQGVQGGLRGGAEGVWISYNPNTAGWYLRGKSAAPSSNSMIGGTIGCIGDG